MPWIMAQPERMASRMPDAVAGKPPSFRQVLTTLLFGTSSTISALAPLIVARYDSERARGARTNAATARLASSSGSPVCWPRQYEFTWATWTGKPFASWSSSSSPVISLPDLLVPQWTAHQQRLSAAILMARAVDSGVSG